MKRLIKSSFVLFFSVLFLSGFTQNECKVLMPEIAGSYSGGCKKGLANGDGVAIGTDKYTGHFKKGYPDGEGTYTWSTGEVYVGDWRMGKREGKGTFTFKANGKEVQQTGLWKADKYLGEIVPDPKVYRHVNLDRYTFRKMGDTQNRVLVDLYQNSVRNTGVEDFTIVSNSGIYTWLNYSRGFDAVEFPVKIKVNYVTWNKMRTQKLYVNFEFEIYEPGDWRVTLYN